MKKRGLFSKFIGHISSCMLPVIPSLVAGGLIKMLILFLSYTTLFEVFPDTKVILEVISSAPFYFLPFTVAYFSAKHFNTNVINAMVVVGAMLMPEFINLMEEQRQILFAGIPVYSMTYAYTVFPIIVLIFIMSIWEGKLKRLLKDVWNSLFLNLLIILVIALIGMIVIGPIVGIISQGVLWIISWLQNNFPVLAWAIFDATVPIQVITGTHWIFASMAIINLGEFGVESGVMVGFFILTMSLTAISLVAQHRTTDKNKKNMYVSTLITTFFTGITEPALYGICLKSKTAMIASTAAGLIAGIYHGIVKIQAYVYTFPTVFSILMFHSDDEPSNMLKAIIAGLISFIVALFIMIIWYKEDEVVKEVVGEEDIIEEKL